jgi:Protein of unknown function (DUF2975)
MKALGKGSVASIIRVGLLITWIVLWMAAAGLIIAAIAYTSALGLIAAGVIDPNTLSNANGHFSITSGEGSISASFDDPNAGTWPVVVPAFLVGGVAVGGGLVIVWRLRKLFASFSSGEPFRRENAMHLRVIWIALLSIEISRYLLLALTSALLAAFSPGEGVRAAFELKIDLSTWVSILILIVLAEVFREGARLKEEQELTI